MCSLITVKPISVLEVPAQQIKQRKQKNPNDIDKVPVKPDDLDRTVILRIEPPLHRIDQRNVKQSRADDHVQRVHAGHREIDPVEHLDLFHRCARQQMQLVVIERLAFCLNCRIERIAGNQCPGIRWSVYLS